MMKIYTGYRYGTDTASFCISMDLSLKSSDLTTLVMRTFVDVMASPAIPLTFNISLTRTVVSVTSSLGYQAAHMIRQLLLGRQNS
jgi:hypothetical protein